jgi:hypothetical protein
VILILAGLLVFRAILGTIGNVLVVPVEALVAGILSSTWGAAEGQPPRHNRRQRSRPSRCLPASGA